VKIVPWLRALGSVLVCWTAIVCALHTRIDVYSWATASALYIGWLVIGLVGLAVVYFMYKRHRAEQAQVVEESGLREAINALLGVTGMLTVGDALSGPTVDEASTWRRGKAIEQRIRGAGSLAELCDLVLDLEYAILIERLDHKFLIERLPWIINLRRAKENPNQILDELKHAISVLHQGVSGRSMVTYASRNVLALTLRRKCPEEIAWHIFSYLYNIASIESIVRKILELNKYSKFNGEFHLVKSLLTSNSKYLELNHYEFQNAPRSDDETFRSTHLDRAEASESVNRNYSSGKSSDDVRFSSIELKEIKAAKTRAREITKYSSKDDSYLV
jgi:hypothetical protein